MYPPSMIAAACMSAALETVIPDRMQASLYIAKLPKIANLDMVSHVTHRPAGRLHEVNQYSSVIRYIAAPRQIFAPGRTTTYQS